ncbi:MAG: hypothetical protein IT379_39325 [Deltaproteobacteria bacterium]|nr:hypothetical protein [Deltaproteobacteria bacterium]
MRLDPPTCAPTRPLDEIDVLERIEAEAFASRRDLREGDAATARARYRRIRELMARLPG